jgi:mono/diheme cytochrome c family protein
VVAPFVKWYCAVCHGAKDPEGKVSSLGLAGDLSKPRELQVWQAAYERLEGQEMPRRDAEQPSFERA